MNKDGHNNPIPTVDIIIENDGKILCIKRKKEPFKDSVVLPGGFVNENETVESAAIRECKEETSLSINLTEILGVYSDPNRDPRGHIMSVVFIGEIKNITQATAVAGDDAKEIAWVELDLIDKSSFGFDHSKILSDFKRWKLNKGTYWSAKE